MKSETDDRLRLHLMTEVLDSIAGLVFGEVDSYDADDLVAEIEERDRELAKLRLLRKLTPEGLAEMFHEAGRRHDVGLAAWGDQPEWVRAQLVTVAADVIDKLAAFGTPAERA